MFSADIGNDLFETIGNQARMVFPLREWERLTVIDQPLPLYLSLRENIRDPAPAGEMPL